MPSADLLHSPHRSSQIANTGAGRLTGVAWRAILLDGVIACALFLMACWQYSTAIDTTPFHRDEARWVHRASYVRELAHPLGPYWDESTWKDQGGTLDEQNRLRAQPPLGSYLMGLGLLLQGRDLDVNGFWNMDRDNAWNEQHGNMPARADLTAARRIVAVVSALTMVVVYAIGTRITNRVGGVVAALFFGFHPLVMLYAVFAGSDMLLVFLVALSALAAYRLADHPSWPRALLVGVLLGLGGATKLSPLGVAAGLALLGGVTLISRFARTCLKSARGGESVPTDDRTMCVESVRRLQEFMRAPAVLGWQLISVPLVAGATFVASYPYLWRAPLDHTVALFEYRSLGMDLQAAIWTHVAVETPVEALRRVGTRLGDEFTVLERFGVRAGEIELAVAAVGLLVFMLLVLKRGLFSGTGLAMAVLVGQAAITILGMRVDWARYHLPILLLVAIGAGVAAGWTWSIVRRSLSRPHSTPW